MLRRYFFFIAVGVITSVTPAFADAGVPMIALTLPGMLIVLAPIITVESYLLVRSLQIGMWRSMKVMTIANVVSTIIGMPVTWVLLVLMELMTSGGRAYGMDTLFKRFLAVTWQAAWLIPYEEELHWMIPAATLVLLVPFFFASWFVEYQVAKALLREVSADAVKKAVLQANVASYGLLGGIVLRFLVAR